MWYSTILSTADFTVSKNTTQGHWCLATCLCWSKPPSYNKLIQHTASDSIRECFAMSSSLPSSQELSTPFNSCLPENRINNYSEPPWNLSSIHLSLLFLTAVIFPLRLCWLMPLNPKIPRNLLFSSNPIPDWAGSFHVFLIVLYTPPIRVFNCLLVCCCFHLALNSMRVMFPLIPVILCPSIQHRICGRFFPPRLQKHCG